MSIKGVVFDYGRVISYDQPEDTMEKLASIAGMDAKTLESLVWGSRAEFDRGTLSGREYYRELLKTAGVVLDDDSLQKMVAIDVESWSSINPKTVKLMEDLKAAGITLGILSNMPHDFLSLKYNTLDVFRLPEISIFSCKTGFIKPEIEIYNILVQEFKSEPGELVFFDDIQKNIDGALAAGIRGFLWTDPDQGRRDLNNLGVPV